MIILLPWINPLLIRIIPSFHVNPSHAEHEVYILIYLFFYQILVYCYGGWSVEVVPTGIDK